ncbi:MAG: molybdenum cofactor biosysynthesis protein [Betaproteobacteria bacterium RIFCSPLOWO2_12_FULL_65_14]|nr:MAG: molybdenum cofactor biosysynthesis protein [Betaproteobacteria bacterium RIFCSPLOWO2_12_FULL_65_14]
MGWSGHLTHIHIAEQASAPMQPLESAKLIAGVGIEGDRYATGRGYYSNTPRADRQVTLIEVETLEALARDHGIELLPSETRRNLTTRDVPLNHLVGRRFRVGAVLLLGARLNVPCKYLEQVTGKLVYAPLTNRSGLNCEIIEGGIVRIGDALRPA